MPQKKQFLQALLNKLGNQKDNTFVAKLEISDDISFKVFREQSPHGSDWVMESGNFTMLASQKVSNALSLRHFEILDPSIDFPLSINIFDSGVVRHGRKKFELLRDRLGKIKIDNEMPDFVDIASIRFYQVLLLPKGNVKWACALSDVSRLNEHEFEANLYKGRIQPYSKSHYTLLSVHGFASYFINPALCFDKIFNFLPKIQSNDQAQYDSIELEGETISIQVVHSGSSTLSWAIPNSGLAKLARAFDFKPVHHSFWSIPDELMSEEFISKSVGQQGLMRFAMDLVGD